MKTKGLMVLVVVVAVMLSSSVSVKACLIDFSITVSADDGVNQENQIFNGSGYTDADGKFVWDLGNEVSILDGAIESLSLTLQDDPEVGIEFGIRAGNSATTYSIVSDVVSFDPLVNPAAYASAGVTLTDRTPSGATLKGLFEGGKTHQARYNGSSVFANLVDGFTISGGTLTKNEDKGNEFSTITITDTVSSIESQFYFTLSAKDSASGTSNFVVTPAPEPTTICLLGLGVLGLVKKRRH